MKMRSNRGDDEAYTRTGSKHEHSRGGPAPEERSLRDAVGSGRPTLRSPKYFAEDEDGCREGGEKRGSPSRTKSTRR